MKRFVRFVQGIRMPVPQRVIVLSVFAFLVNTGPAAAIGNQDLLERRITLQLTKVPLTNAIRQIETAAATSFYFDQKILRWPYRPHLTQR